MGGSSEEEEKDEMDSLFEGMILINPSPMPDYDDNVVVHQQLTGTEQQQQQQQQQQQSGPPPPSSFESDNTLVSQPLDENLFSDLTLITPLQNQLSLLQVQPQPDPPDFPPPTTTTTADDNDTTATANNNSKVGEVVIPSSVVISRQISTRKKKRAGGLRIGYGRDAPNILDDQPELPPLPPPAESELELESESRRSDDPQQQQQQQQQDSSCSLSPTASLSINTEVVDRDFPDNTRSCKEEEEVGSAAAHSRVDDDNLVSDAAEPTTTADQVNDGGGGAPIEVRFERIKAQISQKLTRIRELVASVSAARKDSTRKRRKAAETVNLASARYRQLEKQLEEACEAEDFERAERVSESLASVEKEKECLAIDLKHAEADCDAVDSKMQEVLQCQIVAEEECATLLKNFSMDAANDADLVLKSAEISSEKELDRWLSLTEELELKKMELDIESHLINAAQLVLNDSIERSVEDDRRERELLCKRKETLTEELEILLALVKQKEAEIAKTDHSIETVDKRIADVVSGFQEVHSMVDTKYGYLQSDLSQIELENEALTRKKKEIDDFLSQEKDRGTKLQELAQISADEANMYQGLVELRKSLVLFILKSREDKVRLGKTEEKLSEDVHMLEQEISAARASLQELSSTKSSFQQEIESLKQRLVFIEKRVPELEAEKKVAAAARNFKEAARIATESKTLSVEKDGLQIKIAEAVLKIGKLEEDICNTVNRLQETEGQISSKEKEVAMARFQRLLLVAGAAKAERSAALELGDLEEAGSLLAEEEAAESEARKIQPVYNLEEEEFTNLPKQYISMELVSNLGGKQLAELAASAYISTM